MSPKNLTSPFSMKIAFSARVRATLTDCSTTITVVPRAWIWRTMSSSWPTTAGARPRESSSIISNRGLARKAWASDSICCSPPDSDAAASKARSRRIGKISNTSSRRACCSSAVSVPFIQLPRTRFSRTDRPGKIPRPPGMWITPRAAVSWGGMWVMSRPSKTMAPALASWVPLMARSSVDLPAPLVPRRAMIWPSSTSKSTPKSTCTPSYATSTSRQTRSFPRPDALAARHSASAIEAARALRRSNSKNDAAERLISAPATANGTQNRIAAP